MSLVDQATKDKAALGMRLQNRYARLRLAVNDLFNSTRKDYWKKDSTKLLIKHMRRLAEVADTLDKECRQFGYSYNKGKVYQK